jgi:hypothetical protein
MEMRLLSVFSLFAMLTAAAATPADRTKPVRQKVVIQPVVIPAEAVESEPGVWHYTDGKGKQWVYYKTPFGVVRAEEKPVAASADPAARAAEITAIDDGDYVRFERRGPFGVYKWRTKKTELNDEERAAWARVNAPEQD